MPCIYSLFSQNVVRESCKEESLNSVVDFIQTADWSLKHECMNSSAEESKKRVELRSELMSASCEKESWWFGSNQSNCLLKWKHKHFWRIHLFPAPSVGNFHKFSGLKNIYSFMTLGQKPEIGFTELKWKCWQDCIHSGGSVGDSVSLPYPPSV